MTKTILLDNIQNPNHARILYTLVADRYQFPVSLRQGQESWQIWIDPQFQRYAGYILADFIEHACPGESCQFRGCYGLRAMLPTPAEVA